ncbi:MAG TPA: aspartate dehydrogenase [Rhodoblastus sp.]|nr:aspartate dehydrogenase [Rhodoblastus sp.]
MNALPVSDRTDAKAVARPALRVALIGWGAIARRFSELIRARNGARVEIAALCLRRTSPPADGPQGARIVADPAALSALGVDLVIEAAGRDAVAQWGEAALAAAPAFAVSSTSAFCDDALLARLLAAAEANRSQIVVPAGALAGVDGLAAASVLGLAAVVHSIVKPPAAWKGTEAETLCDLAGLESATVFFEGAAREAARRFPQNANVAVISALAGLGLDRTKVRLVADPRAARNGHSIRAEGDFGVMEMTIQNRPLAANPKSSEMTALNLVRMVENRIRPLAC